MNPIIIVLIMIVLAAAITIFNNYNEKKKEEKERSKMLDEKMNYTYKFTEDISDEEYKKQMLNMLNLINMNLVDQEMKKNKEIEHLKEIRSGVNFITTLIVIMLLAKLIIIIASAKAGASIFTTLF